MTARQAHFRSAGVAESSQSGSRGTMQGRELRTISLLISAQILAWEHAMRWIRGDFPANPRRVAATRQNCSF